MHIPELNVNGPLPDEDKFEDEIDISIDGGTWITIKRSEFESVIIRTLNKDEPKKEIRVRQ